MQVSIIIVNYNTKELLCNCLNSIYQNTKDINFEIIVSDNGSTDGSIDTIRRDFEKVILIENNKNIGFGAANNKGLDIARGRYVFYLNSDTVLQNNAIKIFFDFWKNYHEKDVLGAIGCNLVDENYEITHSYGNFPTVFNQVKILLHINASLFIKSIFRIFKYNYQHLRKKPTMEKYIGAVDYITGADLFCLNDKTMRFNEQFFLYFEEVELQYRLYLRKRKRLLINGPIIQHTKGGSNSIKDDFQSYSSFSVIQSLISRIIYFIITKRKYALIIIKFLTLCILCNPFLLRKTYKYIKKIIFLH
jgi:GT2 family glycosyltransferase